MNRFIKNTVLVSTLLLSYTLPVQAAEYTLDPAHTNVVWQANHLGFSNPSGKFSSVSGTLTLDEAKPENSKVNVTIYPGGVMTGNGAFDTHLRSPDFFNIEKFPISTFVSDRVDITGKDTAKVRGKLTLLGITKPVTLSVRLNKIGENPMTKKKTAGFSAAAMLRRSEFGIVYALPGLGYPGVSDEVKILIEAEATLNDEASAPTTPATTPTATQPAKQ